MPGLRLDLALGGAADGYYPPLLPMTWTRVGGASRATTMGGRGRPQDASWPPGAAASGGGGGGGGAPTEGEEGRG